MESVTEELVEEHRALSSEYLGEIRARFDSLNSKAFDLVNSEHSPDLGEDGEGQSKFISSEHENESYIICTHHNK